MKKQKIRLIVSDIDGTILNDQHQVDQNLKDQIPLLKKKISPLSWHLLALRLAWSQLHTN
ncbi:haloacid dehalogenase-like hydrolase domain protein [Streptococcus constellatus subsp. pharyngis SK1060 = CCUG 46377]|uniref:Haloacid dehalogenase-like hydrolase domain protein n=1 Tax=Streptococcus constellatus subsp. pharyngis SK1060 = CCUG 46377 TaxID=1035184 RepID=F9PAG6_STRCV|nr:haloacid dehalogenase-like hydrolase domain protein [Streptococcus constellatus subsp. pharyngis SK1060 = CCUG 46377]